MPLIELIPAWCKWLNNLYGLNIQPKDVTDWNVTKFFPTLTKDQVFEPLHIDRFWATVKPKKDAVKYIKKLIDDGFNLYLCTTTDYRNVKPKYECIIMRYFPFISWRHIIVAGRKQMIKADILIDDGVHNQEGGDYNKILVSAPHNRMYDAEGNGMIRAEGWDFIYNTVIDMAKKITGV